MNPGWGVSGGSNSYPRVPHTTVLKLTRLEQRSNCTRDGQAAANASRRPVGLAHGINGNSSEASLDSGLPWTRRGAVLDWIPIAGPLVAALRLL